MFTKITSVTLGIAFVMGCRGFRRSAIFSLQMIGRFCEEILQKVGSDETLLDSVRFSDEAELHLVGVVRRRSCRIRSSQPPQEVTEHRMDMPKVAAVTEVRFVDTWCEIECRFDVCRPTNGAHVETCWVTRNL